MDFHSFTRRELQALCKKNKIPANLTNVAMADALLSLEFVDGVEEILSSCESETANSFMESPGNSEIVTSVPRTSRRATQQKAFNPETLQTLTRSRCITRGKVVRNVDEAKNDMQETSALPTTRRRAVATSVRAKLESAMKECEPKEKTGDRIQGEMKDVPNTPAVLTSQRKELKASSVRQPYSTRRSARIAGKPMQGSTQENEMSGTLTFDVFPEETEENLEVDSEQHSIHKNEEVDKNGQYTNTLVQNEIETEDVLRQESNNNLVVVLDTKAEEGSEEVPLGHSNNRAKIEEVGEESMEESEIDQARAKTEKDFQNKSQNLGEDNKRNSDITNVILMKQPHEEDKPHCDDTSDFVAENDREEEDHLNHADVAGGQKLMGEPASVNRDTNIDFHEVSSLGKFNGEGETKVSGSQQCLKDASKANMEDAGEEEPMEEDEVDHAEANVDSAARGLEVAEEENPMEESEVDYAEANVEPASVNRDTNIDFDEVSSLGQFNGEGEAKVSGSQQCLKDASEANMEDAGEEPMEEYEVDHAEANVDSAAHGQEVAEEENPMEESEVDYAEANVDNAAHGLPPLASLIPDDAAQEGECKVKVRGNQQCSHVSEVEVSGSQQCLHIKVRGSQRCLHVSEIVAGEEPMEESEIDHAMINVDIAAHALPPQASLIPNAIPEPVYKGIAGNDSKQSLQDLSLRKLKKMLKVAEEKPMEESEVDYAEANLDNAAHGLPHLASLIPDDAAQEGECKVKVRGSQQCLHVSEVVAGDEPMEESEIDHAAINVDIAARALPPQASLIPNAIPELVYKGIAGNDSKQSLQDLSLRKLTKMLKECRKRS